ncbi:hypothetical protein [Acinetobacter boissieri]|uniref:Uncharacterized protein n=1 Tax=Acinetobacter boissieri TaxID=1219383 RepID=A0A1G6GY20_9GAMM|nr:hypothetical protein [Acinetobacter boissieri]SDB86841.1 hypothetical protein SAMN05421733_10311 [Acinetobacter boissieri]
MFGFKRANQSKPEQDHIHFGFDSAKASDLQDSVQALSSTEVREQQSMQEHFRELAVGIVASLVEQVGEGLDEDTLPTDVLDALMLSATDGLDDQETDDTAWELLLGSLQDALNAFGVDDSALAEMFNDDLEIADAAIESVCDTVLGNMPDDGEPLDIFIRDFVYGHEDDEASFDSLAVGHTMVRKVAGKNIQYKAKAVIRRGKKTIVHKRLPNQKVRLTAKQKGALTKARMKAHTANAIKMRVKSFKKGRKLGYY